MKWFTCLVLVFFAYVHLVSGKETDPGKPKVETASASNQAPPPDVVREVLQEEMELMGKEKAQAEQGEENVNTMQQNIDKTMEDIAIEERKRNKQNRKTPEETISQKKTKSQPGTKNKKTENQERPKKEEATKTEKNKKVKKSESATDKKPAQAENKPAGKSTEKTASQKEQKAKRPNIVILYADDLGYGDVGCFGNDTIRTPAIDGICRDGARLTHHLTADATCTPSRAAFLTGRLPKRLGIASADLFPVFIYTAQKSGLPTNETTFAKALQNNGYKTALIGKWHLGLNCETPWDGCHGPLEHGFDYFYGLPLSNFRNLGEDGGDMIFLINPNIIPTLAAIFLFGIISLSFFKKYLGFLAYILGLGCIFYASYSYLRISNMQTLNSVLLRQNEVVEQPIRFENLVERFAREGEQFLERRQQDGSPFLLFMSWDQVHTHMHASKRFRGKSAHGSYGDEVEEMDWSTGRILNKLDELGLSDNTIVYFSSDNGGHHEEFNEVTQQVEGGHNGIFSGGKVMGGQEGGIRVPSVIKWPSHIQPGITIDAPTSQMDIYPTLLQAVGIEPPRDRVLDGRTILPLLKGKTTRSPHQVMFHYCAHWLHAARYIPDSGTDVYKVHWYWPDWLPGQERCEGFACSCQLHHHLLPSPVLYNVARDPQEKHPLDLTNPENAAILAKVEQLKKEHEDNMEPVPDQFDFFTRMYRPWLQPCCNFPHCNCKEPDNLTL